MMEFIMDNYIWIMIILIAALLACVGYLVDKKEKKNTKKEKVKKEKNVKDSVVNEEMKELQPISAPEFDNSQEQNIDVVEEPAVEPQQEEITVEKPVLQEESLEDEFSVGIQEEKVEEPTVEEITVEELQPSIFEQPEMSNEEIKEEINSEFDDMEALEPLQTLAEVEEEETNSLEEKEELTPIEQPRSELTDSSDELLLERDSSIDQDFQNLLENEEVESELPLGEDTRKEEFKSIDDDDEDLWTF